jgi:hypothetical protein
MGTRALRTVLLSAAALVAALLAPLTAPASATGTVHLTHVLAVTLNTHDVDVTTGARTVVVRVHATRVGGLSEDDILVWAGPSAGQATAPQLFPEFVTTGPLTLTDDAWFTATTVIPRYAEPGLLDIGISAFDSTGLDHQSVQSRALRVRDSRPDTQTPRIAWFAMSPTSIDVRQHDVLVHVSVHVVDDLAGVDASTMRLELHTPDAFSSLNLVDLHRVSGTAVDGVWSGTSRIYRNSPSGDWTAWMFVRDRAHTSGIAMAGPLDVSGGATLPGGRGTLVVTGLGDSIRPDIRSVRMTPVHARVGVFGARTMITVMAHLVDRGGDGVRRVEAMLYGVDGHAVAARPVSGTPADGVWRLRFTVPSDSPGSWYLALRVSDVGHTTLYAPAHSPERATFGGVRLLTSTLLGGQDGVFRVFPA